MFSKHFLFFDILVILIKQSLINTKNIILNINRVSFENFIGENKVDDFINYDLFTEIEVGTPPQKVTHFIDSNDRIFQFKKTEIRYNSNKFNNSVSKFFENRFFLFNSSKSSSYIGSFSDNFIFDTNENEKIEVKKLNFTIYLNNRNDENKYGIIGLQTMSENQGNSFFQELYSFINQLKKLNIISDYSFCFLYNNNKNIFESGINLGKIIIGENPMNSNSNNDINNKDEEIKIYSSSKDIWSIKADEIKFDNYIENNIQLNFDFNSKFIKGSKDFNAKIKKIFFDELIENNLCKIETISENKYIFNYEIYSCYDNIITREKIKKFPKLNFINKSTNTIFSFDYTDLFQIFPNKDILYFMVIFSSDKYTFLTDTWLIGEIFLKKYRANFNLESKTVTYYKNQIYKIDENLEKSGNKKTNNILRIIIEVMMGVIIIFCFYLLYRKYKKSRKLLANELEDNNYAYISNENKNSEN